MKSWQGRMFAAPAAAAMLTSSSASASSSREDSGLLLDFDSERAYGTTALPIAGSHGEEARPNPDERAMGSTASGSAAPLHAIGPALPPHIEIKRDGGGREGVGGH